MAAEIKLTKADESPWGFRLTGGRDFGTPLTILKVAINSVAEQAGLKVGDILMRINNESGHALTHRDAQEVIRKSGNTITFSVLRGVLNIPEEVIERLTPLPIQEFISQTPDPNAQAHQEQNQQNQQQAENRLPVVDPNIQIIPIKDLEPEQLAELGLKPLPSDFLEKALRDPSPLPEVRPQLNETPLPDVLEALDQLGLQDVVQDIEKQKEIENVQAAAAAQAQAQAPVQEAPKENLEGESQETAPVQQEAPAIEQTQEQAQVQPQEAVPPPEFIANQPLTEETFAEIMSGKAEVIDGSAIGVDFKKFEPQTNFLKKSQVFQTLQEEQQQGEKKKETEKEKRWTTFLEKPDRPKPKPKPKTPKTQNKGETPKAQEGDATPTPTPTPEPPSQLYEIPPQEEFEALVKVPEPASETQPESQPEQVAQTQEGESQPEDQVQADEPIQETCPEKQGEEVTEEEHQLVEQQQVLEKQLSTDMTVEEKSDIELQLEEIQKQLEAIRQLPFEIQQHLSMVQDQLTKIVQHRTHEETDKIPAAPRPSIAEPEPVEPPKQEETLEETPENTAGEQQAEEEEQTGQAEQPQESEPQPESQPQDQPQEEFKLKPEEEEAILPPPKEVGKCKEDTGSLALGEEASRMFGENVEDIVSCL